MLTMTVTSKRERKTIIRTQKAFVLVELRPPISIFYCVKIPVKLLFPTFRVLLSTITPREHEVFSHACSPWKVAEDKNSCFMSVDYYALKADGYRSYICRRYSRRRFIACNRQQVGLGCGDGVNPSVCRLCIRRLRRATATQRLKRQETTALTDLQRFWDGIVPQTWHAVRQLGKVEDLNNVTSAERSA